MVSGRASTGGNGSRTINPDDSSESHETDGLDEIDSSPVLRRRFNKKFRPQSELINQILIDKLKVYNTHTRVTFANVK